MGSGELTATMVEVHKELLAPFGSHPKAVFLDTPAGFQLNADQLSHKAAEYFERHVGHSLKIASYKARERLSPFEAEQALQPLREADYILIGPGSPTYALRQWRSSPIPEIFLRRVESGGCLAAASAAALTVGKFTLPVYEIYKVGLDLHWAEGLDILGRFGLPLVIIPHWNNAEGGTHDTRFCYMGQERFSKLEAMLPEEVFILGLDEHTACILDFGKNQFTIKGLGRVIIRRRGWQKAYEKGGPFPLAELLGEELRDGLAAERVQPVPPTPEQAGERPQDFWVRIHALEDRFSRGLETGDLKQTLTALLDLDGVIWKGLEDLESQEFITQARETLRDWIVLLGARLDSSATGDEKALQSLVDELTALRETFRREKKWAEADALRTCLQRAGIRIEDTPEGPRWQWAGMRGAVNR
jgi:peptidase E